jgi:hypothetical protein
VTDGISAHVQVSDDSRNFTMMMRYYKTECFITIWGNLMSRVLAYKSFTCTELHTRFDISHLLGEIMNIFLSNIFAQPGTGSDTINNIKKCSTFPDRDYKPDMSMLAILSHLSDALVTKFRLLTSYA